MPAKKHGFVRGTPMQRKVYRAWCHAKDRCFNERHVEYHNYGGRGIVMSDELRYDFEAFFAEVGFPEHSSLSLDRIDNEKGYEPGNIAWATKQHQAANARPRFGLPPLISDAVRKEVKKLAALGLSTRAIAGKVGCGKTLVWKLINET